MPKPLATIYHLDLYGRRNEKYDALEKLSLHEAKWVELAPVKPYYFFVPKDFGGEEEYKKGFSINQLMKINSNGVETKCDELAIQYQEEYLDNVLDNFINLDLPELKVKYSNKEDSSGWNFKDAKANIKNTTFLKQVIQYRPFDYRYTILTQESGGFIGRSRYAVMRNFIAGNNLGLLVCRQTAQDFRHVFITKNIVDGNITASAKLFGTANIFPLYLYSDSENLTNQTRTPNLDETIWSAINTIVGETTPEQILDYIYAVLHSPSYREKYKEFLKIDFPRVPYPRDRESFLALVALGGELRSLHLLESSKVEDFITSYPVAGDNVVENVKYIDEKVFINATQYFGGVPELVWTHPIGGYMPAQKWLKDRKGRTLTNDDIMHYQRMIVALTETARVMAEVDGFINI